MLFALGLSVEDFAKAQVGIGTVWLEGNPCNAKLDKLSSMLHKSLNGKDLLPLDLIQLEFQMVCQWEQME